MFLSHARSVSILSSVVLVLGSASNCIAEESNRNEVRANLSSGNWTVVWGKNFTEGDWIRGTQAIGASVATENPGPFLAWFDATLQENFNKIRSNLPGALQADLERWVAQSLKEQRIIVYNGLQIQAGFATYNRWQREVHDEPRTVMVYKKFPWGGGMHVPSVEMHRVENTIPLPNWHQFYIRYRFVGGSHSPQPSVTFRTGQVIMNNDYGQFVTIRLYHPANPNVVFSSWNFVNSQPTAMTLPSGQMVVGSDWGIQIVFGNGATSPVRKLGSISGHDGTNFRVAASRVWAG